LCLEPGRAIVGNAGIFVTKVEFLKQNSEHAFAIVDGAMNDLLHQIPLGLNACCIFFINGQNLVIGIVKTGAYVDAIISKVGLTEIILEPGRAIVGNAGIFVTKVEFLKQNSDHSFAIVDGAMNDLLRPSFYNAYHQVLPINEKNKTGTQAQWDLVGPICETGDFLAKNRALSLSEGDYLALMSAGAYGFTMRL
jgi:diaminopimelate decarboxylase